MFFEVAIATPDPTKPAWPSDQHKRVRTLLGAGLLDTRPNGSVSFGSQTNPNQGFVAWYSGTSNNDGQSGKQCTVTVTLAEAAPATLKVYDVPGYNGTVETTSTASGVYISPAPGQFPWVSAQTTPVTTTYPLDLMLGSLLQVNQQLTPATYWANWLTR